MKTHKDISIDLIDLIFNHKSSLILSDDVVRSAQLNRVLDLIPETPLLIERQDLKQRMLADARKVSDRLLDLNVKSAIVKSQKGLPSNIDLVVEKDEPVRQVLRDFGHVPILESRYKTMFCRFDKPKNDFLKIHVHRQIAWEEIIYFDKAYFLSTLHNGEPSLHHEFLIDIAHAFFEHRKIRLKDIFAAEKLICEKDLDWEEIKKIAWEWRYGLAYFLVFVKKFFDYYVNEKKILPDTFHLEDIAPPEVLQRYEEQIDSSFGSWTKFPYIIPKKIYQEAFRIKLFSGLKNFDVKSIQNYIWHLMRSRHNYVRRIYRRLKYDPLIITFSGVDGSGKSLHVKKLTERIGKERCYCGYGRYFHQSILTRPISKIARMRNIYPLHREKPDSVLARIWAYSSLLDFPLVMFFQAWIPRFRYKICCFDRYIFDSYVDLRRIIIDDKMKIFSFLYFLVPKPDIAFLCDAAPEIIRDRKQENPIDNLRRDRAHFLAITGKTKIYILDTTLSEAENQETIFNTIINSGDEIKSKFFREYNHTVMDSILLGDSRSE